MTSRFVVTIGRASSARIGLLQEQCKYKAALELFKCTFHYLMAHQDRTRLCARLTMAGSSYPRCSDTQVQQQMMEVSRVVLTHVLPMVETSKIGPRWSFSGKRKRRPRRLYVSISARLSISMAMCSGCWSIPQTPPIMKSP